MYNLQNNNPIAFISGPKGGASVQFLLKARMPFQGFGDFLDLVVHLIFLIWTQRATFNFVKAFILGQVYNSGARRLVFLILVVFLISWVVFLFLIPFSAYFLK